MLDYDEKRIHFFCELHHAQEGWLSATSEQLALHVDLGARRVTPWPDDILERLAAMKAAHAALPAPEAAGRAIALKART
jgi:acyl-CoA thioester hydrolase